MTNGDGGESVSVDPQATVVAGMEEVVRMETVEGDAARLDVLQKHACARLSLRLPIGAAPATDKMLEKRFPPSRIHLTKCVSFVCIERTALMLLNVKQPASQQKATPSHTCD